jgi:hypothetical protein
VARCLCFGGCDGFGEDHEYVTPEACNDVAAADGAGEALDDDD